MVVRLNIKNAVGDEAIKLGIISREIGVDINVGSQLLVGGLQQGVVRSQAGDRKLGLHRHRSTVVESILGTLDNRGQIIAAGFDSTHALRMFGVIIFANRP